MVGHVAILLLRRVGLQVSGCFLPVHIPIRMVRVVAQCCQPAILSRRDGLGLQRNKSFHISTVCNGRKRFENRANPVKAYK